MTKFRFYIVDEDGVVAGTDSDLLALCWADKGITVLDTETGKYGDNTDQLSDFVDVDEADEVDDLDLQEDEV